MYTLGIDTSNYTTSVALYNSADNSVIQKKRLLPVKAGEIGIRQSDAVFHHTAALYQLLEELLEGFDGKIEAIGCSDRPREIEGSYMPCFTVGFGTAKSIAAVNSLPLYCFSHQQGHIAAAAYSANAACLLKERFVAFHVSGGTTEAVTVTPNDEKIVTCDYLCGSLDLKAGQAIDRVGRMLGLSFPAGMELEKLAQQCTQKVKTRPVIKEMDCCLSGLENQCAKMMQKGEAPSYIARFCLESVGAAIIKMTEAINDSVGKLPLLYAGGVMSDKIIKDMIKSNFDCYFAKPEFSCDNAAGVAFLAAIKNGGTTL